MNENTTIEAVIIGHLTGALTATVGPEVPDGPPAEYVTVEKRSQYEENGLMYALVDVHSAGPTMLRTIELDREVRAAMKTLTETVNIFRVQLENNYNDPDTALKQRRYLAQFEITFKED